MGRSGPLNGFRATQYLAAFAFAIRKASTPIAEKRAEEAAAREASEKFEHLLSDTEAEDAQTRKRLLNRVKVNHQMVLSTQFRPHNNLGAVNEEELAAAFAAMQPRTLPKGSSGNVIVGCMKNEAPISSNGSPITAPSAWTTSLSTPTIALTARTKSSDG